MVGLLIHLVLLVVFLAHVIFYMRLYTGFVLPSLNEEMVSSWRQHRDQVARYLALEEQAGRNRWYFGVARHGLPILSILIVLWVATGAIP
jgi:hypothetical protein